MTRVQILDEAICISYCINTLGKCMNPTILPPTMYESNYVWIQLFSLQLWLNRRTDLTFWIWYGNQSRRRKIQNLNHLKNWPNVTFCSWRRVSENTYIFSFRNFFYIDVLCYIYIYIYIYIYLCECMEQFKWGNSKLLVFLWRKRSGCLSEKVSQTVGMLLNAKSRLVIWSLLNSNVLTDRLKPTVVTETPTLEITTIKQYFHREVRQWTLTAIKKRLRKAQLKLSPEDRLLGEKTIGTIIIDLMYRKDSPYGKRSDVVTKWNNLSVTQFGTHSKTLSGKTAPIHFPTNQLHARLFHGTAIPKSVFGISVADSFLDLLLTSIQARTIK